jgi:hypothetical protein
MKNLKPFNSFRLFALVLFSTIGTNAATITWTNSAGGNWSVTNNWSPNQVPGASDTAFITNSGTYVVALDTIITVSGITLGGASGQQTLTTSVNSLSLSQAGMVNSNGIIQLSGGGLFGNLTVNGELNWTGGALGGSSATLTVATNGLLILAGAAGTVYPLGEYLNNSGTVELLGGNLNIDWCGTNYGVFNNLPGALVNIQTDVTITNTCAGAGFSNQGTLRKSGGTGVTYIDAAFNNAGVLELQSGTMVFSGFNTTGTLDVQSGAAVLTDGGSLGGVLQAEAGAAIDLNGGSFVLAGASYFGGAGISALNGGSLTTTNALPPVSQINGGNLIMNFSGPSPGFAVTNGNVTVNGTVTNMLLGGGILGGNMTVMGTLTWTNGMLGGSSATMTLATNAVLVLDGAMGTDYYLGQYLTNDGTINLESGNLNIDWCGADYGVLINAPGALVNIQADLAIDNSCGGAGLVNEGTVRKSGGTNSTLINTPFNNTGTLDVKTGTMALASGGNVSGLLQAEAGTAIYETNCTINGGATVVGTVYVTGGTLAATGFLSVSSASVLNLVGTFYIEGPLTNSGTVNWLGGGLVLVNNNSPGDTGGIWNQAGAQWNIQCSQTLSDDVGTGYEQFHNAGLLAKTGGSGTTTFTVYLDNTGGTVQAQVGTIQFANGSNLAGSFQATVTVTAIDFTGGNYNWNGTANFQGNVQITGGNVTITGPISNLVATGVTVSNLVEVTGTAWLTNCTIADAETIIGMVNWSGGTLDGGGSLNITSAGVLNLVGSGQFYIEGPMTNNGTVNWLGGEVAVLNNNSSSYTGGIWNHLGAQWNIECNQPLAFYFATGYEIFHNAGSLSKTGVGGTTTFSVNLDNTGGTVQAQMGTIQFANGSNLAGSFQATAAGTAIDFTGGNYNWSGTPNFQGNVQVTGGTVTVSGNTPRLVATGVTISNLFNVTGTAWLTNCTIQDAETVVGTVNISGGTLNNNGALTVPGTGVLNLVGSGQFYIEGTLTNNGTVNWLGGGVSVLNYPSTYSGGIWNNNGAQWNIECNQNLSDYFGNGSEIFHNAGLLSKTGASGTTTFSVYLDNTGGTVQAQVGTIQFANGSNLAGSFQATAAGSGVYFTAGNYNWNGTPNFQGNVQITGGTVTITGSTPGLAATSVTISNLLNVTGTAWLTNCTIRDAESVSGTINLSGGTLNNGASLTVLTPGVLNLIGNGTLYIEGPLTNNGTVNWQGGGVSVLNYPSTYSGGIWNNNGAQWNIECNQNLSDYFGNGSEIFHNAGLLSKTGVSGTTAFTVYLDNTGGTVQAQVGTIQIANGSDLAGTFQATAAGTAIDFTGGNFSWSGTPNFQGNVQITGGTVTITGTTPELAATSVTISNLVNLAGTAWLTNCSIQDAETLAGTANFAGGTLYGSGSLTVLGTGVLNFIGGGTYGIQGPLTNNGTVNWEGGGLTVVNNNSASYAGGIWNQAGAQWNIECNQNMGDDFGSGDEIFHNAGTLSKTVSGMSTFTVYLNNNAGTIQVEDGVVSLGTGQYSLTNGTLNFWINATNNFGVINLPGAVTLAGAASVTFGPFYAPQIGNAFAFVTYGSHTGAFSGLNLPNSVAWTTNYGTTAFALSVANLNAVQSFVTWTNPAAINYGAPLTTNQLNASANVPGTFVYTPPVGTILNAGSNLLSMFFTPTNMSYNNVNATVVQVVARAPLAVSANNASRVYGQGNPVFTGTISGVVNGDNITANYTCSAVSISPPGPYPIVPNLVDPNSRLANYSVAATNGSLTVTAGSPPTLTGITPATGLTNGATAVSLSGSGFELGAGLTMGGNPATGVTVFSGTQITAVAPTGGVGAVNVVMSNPDGTSATLTNGFVYTGLPPFILSQPANQLVIEGSNAVFQATALYAGGYQWMFNNGNLTDNGRFIGSHSNVLTIAGVQNTNAGNYQVLVTNIYGATNSAVVVLTVLATNPPVIFGVNAAPALQGCVITWQTDVPAYDQVVYGTATNYTSTNSLSSTLGTSHSVTLSGLTPDTLYHFSILVFDQSENRSGDLTFTTLPDTIPPTASFLSAPATVCSLPYTFSWTGSDNVTAATNLLFAYELDSEGWSAFGSATSLMISQLADGQHTFSVKAQDAAANISSPVSFSFTLDTTPPIISELVKTPTDDACVITWQTAEPTEASVNYGPTTAYGQNISSTALGTSHSITLANLPASTAYHFQVTAQDGCGRQTVSADVPFSTLAPPDLQVVEVTAPTNVWTGAGFLVSWADTNSGLGVAAGAWVDKVYLSYTNQLNTNTDILLGTFPVDGPVNSGQAAPQSQLVTVAETGVANGYYYISVLADAGNAVYELTKTNNSGVSAASVYVNQTALPALAVSAVNAPTNALGGQPVTVNWTVCNGGAGATDVPLWYDHLYLSPTTNIADAIDDYGTFANPGYLEPGDCYDQSATVTMPVGVSGNYYFIVKTDSTGLLTQQTTSNNIGSSAIPITIQLVTAGFLHVVSVQVAPAPPSSVWGGDTVTVTWTVKNIGQSDITGHWDDEVTLSPTPVYDFVHGYWDVINHIYFTGPLAPGQSYTHSEPFTVPQGIAPGNWYAVPVVNTHHFAGGNGSIGSGNIGNDQLSTLVLVAPPPPADLVMTSVIAPPNAFLGQAINVQWRVANEGDYETSIANWYDEVYLSTNQVFNASESVALGTLAHLGILEQDASYNDDVSFIVPTNLVALGGIIGTNYLFVLADAGDAVSEITKTNNVLGAAEPVVVAQAQPADLALLQVQAPGTVVAGATATIAWAVTNLGPGVTSVSNWTDSVYLSPGPTLNPATEIHLADFPHQGLLAPGAAYNQSQAVNLPNCMNGSYYVIVFTDSGAQVNEAGATANNLLATTGPIVVWPSQAARLEVGAVTPPASGQAGAPLTVAWTVQNLGNATTTASWDDAVYLSPSSQFVRANSILLGVYPHGSGLGSAASYQQSQSPVVPPCDSGSYYVVVVTDVGEVVNSVACYTNNVLTAAAPIKILPGNFASLQVLGMQVPATVNSGSPWTLQWSVTNAGPSAATGAWSDAIYASVLPTLDTNALLLGEFIHSNGLASGGSYMQTQTVSFLPCLGGEYNVFAVADVSNVVNVAACVVDNVAVSTNSISVNYGLHPDLVVAGVGNTASGFAGQPLAVTWSVTNIGSATATGPWVDSVYLTANPVFSASNSVLLGTYPQTAAIPVDGGYSQSTSFTLPNTNGTFNLVLVVDSGDAVQQCQAAGNNVAFSPTPVNVLASQYPDLKVSSVQVPASASAGQSISVTWIVTNEGTEATPTANWNDALYLSLEQDLNAGDIRLGTFPAIHGLAVGQSYTNTATLLLPAGVTGPCYILGVADSGGVLFEHLDYNDSLGFNVSPMLVSLPPPADLVATSVSVSPASAVPGTPVTINWNVYNNSGNGIPANWTDAVYLSTNAVWDLSAIPVATVDHGGLAADTGYTGSWTGPLPALTPGTYYAIVRADVRASVNELTLTNNTASSTATISVDVPVLVLGQPVTNQLATGGAQYYKFSAPAGDTVQISLTGTVANANNEMFARYGAVPDLGDYDFLYNNPLSPDQQIVIPSTGTGWYYIMVRGGNEPNGPLTNTLVANIVPFSITQISASQIGDNGLVTLAFTGAKFQPGAAVKLLSGTNVYTPSTNLFGGPTKVTSQFLFTNAADGLYDVLLKNPDGTFTTDPGAITIEPAIPLTAEVIPGLINEHPRVGLSFDWNGAVFNAGNVDIQYLTVVVSDDSGFPIALTPPPQAVLTDNNSTDNDGHACLFVARDLAVGAADNFSFVVSSFGATGFYYYIQPTVQSTQDFLNQLADNAELIRESAFTDTNMFISTTTNTQGVVTTNSSTPPAGLASLLSDPVAWEDFMAQSYMAAGLLDSNALAVLPAPTGATLPGGPASVITARDLNGCLSDCNANAATDFKHAVEGEGVCIVGAAAGCVLSGPAYLACLAIASSVCTASFLIVYDSIQDHLAICVNGCKRDNPPPCAAPGGSIVVLGRSVSAKDGSGGDGGDDGSPVCGQPSKDPNELDGPAGYGAAAFVGIQTPWQYSIYFENTSNALAYAAQITITNKLDPSLDIRTFRISSVVIGNVTISVPTNHSFLQIRVPAPAPNPTNIVVDVTVGVDVVNDDIFCTMNAIDLDTGELVTSTQEGVLPPNTTNNVGQGYVVYSIQPRSGMTTGTVVTNQASIVFDINDPIVTNPTTNTVDAVPPVSSMAPLAAVQLTTNFVISWAGVDDAGGSGVGSYDIYFADNHGPWQVFALGETTNSATFDGIPGHAYAFYSLAHDNSGNTEVTPPGTEAATFISTNQPPVLSPITNQVVKVGDLSTIASAAANPAGGSQTLTYSLLNAPAGVTINQTNGVIRWIPNVAQAGTTNLFTVQVANNGIPPLSASLSFLAMVGDYAALSLGSGAVLAGQSVCVPLTLVSSAGLTNLNFTLNYPAAQLGDLSLTPTLGKISLQVVPQDASHAQITLQTVPGTSLAGTQELASVCFTGITNQQSGVATVLVNFSNAAEVDGLTPATLAVSPGTIVVLQGRPFQALSPAAPGQIGITLYGTPGSKYALQSSSSLGGPWTTVNTFIFTNISQSVMVNDLTPGAMYFRMQSE